MSVVGLMLSTERSVVCVCGLLEFYYKKVIFFFKQKTAYEMRISYWSSDVCSSDLVMHYISTRGGAAALDFQGATLTGLASDGGLYLPESWPTFSREDIAALAGLSYVETAVRVMLPFVGDSLDEEELRDLCKQAYGSFSHQGVTPLVQLDHRHWLLELFHG